MTGDLVLLTGAYGNVGSHALPELLRQGYRVRCFDRDPAPRKVRALANAEFVRGDVRDAAAVGAAMAGVDVVIHLAALIPPGSEDDPELAKAVNIGGTKALLEAASASENPPRFLLASTLDVHGHTLSKPPPRHVDDPVVATDTYTATKIECERMLRASGLTWCITRFADVPVLGLRPGHPAMFEIGLDNRIESVHADDVGLALTNALHTPAAWGRVHFIGGGESCQLTYREYLRRMTSAMGLAPLPDNAFGDAEYATDWLDTKDSQALLSYQRHTFDDIVAAVAGSLGWRRVFLPLAAPLARRVILRMSPYLK